MSREAIHNSANDELTLIDEFLAAQRALTPVARFAEQHKTSSTHSGYYRDLIPLSRPAPGQQYAFEVNLDLCSGCKACVTACHSLNGLDEDETWRSVGVLPGSHDSFPQAITTSCHHCLDPGCLTGCPVNAYDKDPNTGIVRHLDDQCIGCQYCVLKCPYDVPNYNAKRGIVRKCDMCSSRLVAGEAPACVQGCPNEAIRIRIVDQVQTAASIANDTSNFLKQAPNPKITLPTTRYLSSWPSAAPLESQPSPAPAHLPLAWMLVLTQLSVGGFVALTALAGRINLLEEGKLAGLSFTALLAGLLVSVFHLGRPHLAWRAVLNLKRSWMSREIALFGALLLFAAIVLVLHLDESLFPNLRLLPASASITLLTALIGISAVFSSVMIYHDTHRAYWNWKATSARFGGTVLILGGALAMFVVQGSSYLSLSALLVILITGSKLGWETSLWTGSKNSASAPSRSAFLLKGPLRRFLIARYLFGAIGGLLCPLFVLNSHDPSINLTFAFMALFFCFLGELLERHLFFTSVAPERMPGSVPS